MYVIMWLDDEDLPFVPWPQSTVAYKASAGSDAKTRIKEKCVKQARAAIWQ